VNKKPEIYDESNHVNPPKKSPEFEFQFTFNHLTWVKFYNSIFMFK